MCQRSDERRRQLDPSEQRFHSAAHQGRAAVLCQQERSRRQQERDYTPGPGDQRLFLRHGRSRRGERRSGHVGSARQRRQPGGSERRRAFGGRQRSQAVHLRGLHGDLHPGGEAEEALDVQEAPQQDVQRQVQEEEERQSHVQHQTGCECNHHKPASDAEICLSFFFFFSLLFLIQENSEERPVSVNKQRLGAMGDRPARPTLIEQVLNQKRLVRVLGNVDCSRDHTFACHFSLCETLKDVQGNKVSLRAIIIHSDVFIVSSC